MAESNTLVLQSFKCFEAESIHLAPITVLTGVNSGGKTSVLAALLLLKHAAKEFLNRDVPSWPIALGGLPIGSQESFPRFGSDVECLIKLGSSNSTSLHVSEAPHRLTSNSVPTFLKSRWRVCSIAHLPLSVEQNIGERTWLDGHIIDPQHALVEYLEFELKRKPGSAATDTPLRTNVERILSSVVSPTQVELSTTNIAGKLRLSYRNGGIESESTTPEQTGAGVTASLPIVIHLASAVSGEVIILQDPEAHLHPHGQSQLGREISRCALRGVQLIVETHSEHILNGIKLGLLERKRDPSSELTCYYLENSKGGTKAVRVDIDSRGLTRTWPAGFFDQAEHDLANLARRLRDGA